MTEAVQRGDRPIMHDGSGNGTLHSDSSPAIDLEVIIPVLLPAMATRPLGPELPRIRSSVLLLMESFWHISSIPSSVSFVISIGILFLSGRLVDAS